MHTLTRAEVALRLRKSIATVRRLECRVLFPVKDGRGVLRFDEIEVERARSNPESVAMFAQSAWLKETQRERERDAPKVSPVLEGGSITGRQALGGDDDVRLANDLQAALGELLLRFEAKHLRASGFDASLFARAFDAVRRLRAASSP